MVPAGGPRPIPLRQIYPTAGGNEKETGPKRGLAELPLIVTDALVKRRTDLTDHPPFCFQEDPRWA